LCPRAFGWEHHLPFYNYAGVAVKESATPTSANYGTTAGGETLVAPAGNSGVDSAGGGEDLLIKDTDGDKTFWVKQFTDIVQVADGLTGTDSIVAWSSYQLPDNVENLTAYGAYNYVAGNDLDNLLQTGNDVNTMYGGGGDDVMVGGFGANAFLVVAGEGNDVIYNFETFQDTVRLPGTVFATFAEVKGAMEQVGSDVVLNFAATDETLTFRNHVIADFRPENFLLPLDWSLIGDLTFHDEFDSLQLYDFSTDSGLWQTKFDGPPKNVDTYSISSNQEQQVYTTADFQGTADHALGYDPFSVNDGILTITATRFNIVDEQSALGRPYSSGMINTRGIFEQKYGYFEIRAELPDELGTWPAFWLVTDPYTPGVEADPLEHLGYVDYGHFVRANDAGTVTGATAFMPDPTGFHTYGLLWTPETTSFYLDGIAVLVMDTPESWVKPMYMIANLAMGGWGGPVDDSVLPAQFNIDYIRAYGLESGVEEVVHKTPTAPSGTLKAAGAATALADSQGWTDAEITTDGTLIVASAIDSGWGSHQAKANRFDPETGLKVGSTINLFEYTGAGVEMIPQIESLPGGYWKISYGGNNTSGNYEIYNPAGGGAFFKNAYTEGDPLFVPLANGGRVFSDPSWDAFGVADAAGNIDWRPLQTVDGVVRAPDDIDALSNGGFVFSYDASTQLTVYDASGAHPITTFLGAQQSTFAMTTAALPDGQFAVSWLSPPPGGGFEMTLNFQTFDSDGDPLTIAKPVALNRDPWHTEINILSTGEPGQAMLLWSQGGAIFGVFANGSTIGETTTLLTGNLSDTTQTALSDGHILLTWMTGTGDDLFLWAEIIDPTDMTITKQRIGATDADAQVHVVATEDGGFAISWHDEGQIYGRAYDGSDDYGPTTTVAGDFLGVDENGLIVTVYDDGSGGALIQHYSIAPDPWL